ncbi:hypothetical protein [Cellvibrio sp. UBA7661]|uniref:substrate-binding periplasmic protein n=1 Tax=Cellvibrio sp. UBA7661 TaxID=1946311 RepID=UPI002F350F69
MRVVLITLLSAVLAVESVAQSDDGVLSHQPHVVNLATNISSSFTSDLPVGSEQTLLPHLQCIFKQMTRDYSVQVIPWRRAYQDVKSNRIDGFFTAIPMRQIDPYAVLSAPMVLENWYWFWRADTIAPESWREGYKLGSILGSQQETWLAEAGYPVDMSANNLPQLIRLLQGKRIDVILADRENFLHAAKELKVDPDHFQSRFFRYVPLGVYFNEQFLNQNPDFLVQFNQHITGCATAQFAVTDYEQQLIKDLLIRKIERWKRLPKLESILKSHNVKNRSLSKQDIIERDKKWTKTFLQGDFSYSLDLVDQELSAQLREIKKQSQDMITEIIVTDERGINVAISDMTSDYWQGDEEKFTTVFAKPANTLHFGAINYDESTKRFQLHLSVPLFSGASAEPISNESNGQKSEPLGVMVFGVDIEKVLSQAQ